jgi:hypothetical protein
MWPPAVEEVAAVFRAEGVEARLEELPEDEDEFPGPGAEAVAFDCESGAVVLLVPAGATVDRRRVPCAYPREIDPPPFPFRGASVHVDRTLLTEPVVWIEAGSSRHVASLAPADLLKLTRARSADLVGDP